MGKIIIIIQGDEVGVWLTSYHCGLGNLEASKRLSSLEKPNVTMVLQVVTKECILWCAAHEKGLQQMFPWLFEAG